MPGMFLGSPVELDPKRNVPSSPSVSITRQVLVSQTSSNLAPSVYGSTEEPMVVIPYQPLPAAAPINLASIVKSSGTSCPLMALAGIPSLRFSLPSCLA